MVERGHGRVARGGTVGGCRSQCSGADSRTDGSVQDPIRPATNRWRSCSGRTGSACRGQAAPARRNACRGRTGNSCRERTGNACRDMVDARQPDRQVMAVGLRRGCCEPGWFLGSADFVVRLVDALCPRMVSPGALATNAPCPHAAVVNASTTNRPIERNSGVRHSSRIEYVRFRTGLNARRFSSFARKSFVGDSATAPDF